MMPSGPPISVEEFRSTFGFKALQDALTAQTPERSVLENGIDLTRLGLCLSASTNLGEGFHNPFTDKSSFPNKFVLSPLYPPPSELNDKNMAGLKDRTLFYLFYNFPDLRTQRLAALRLCALDWVFDSKLRLWIKGKELGNGQPLPMTFFSLESWGPVQATISSFAADRVSAPVFREL